MKMPFYKHLYVQVIIAIVIGIILGHIYPGLAVEMKPLGDAFIKLIRMLIGLIIFCTVVTGIAGMQDLKKVGRIGGKALLYFELVSTLSLSIGLVVAYLLQPGAGFNVDPASLDAKAISSYAANAKAMSSVDFLMNIIPDTLISAFGQGEILQILLISILCGVVLAKGGEKVGPLLTLIESVTHLLFGIVGIVTRLAPIGAFGAIAFTIGRYGIASLVPMAKLIGTLYVTCFLFVFVVLGTIARATGFSLLRLLGFIKDELLIVLGASSGEPALPLLLAKLESLGCSRPVVGLVLPTGYSFNLDGTSIYMTLCLMFIAQAMNIDLSFGQQLAVIAVAMATSKGASGVTGAAFVTLAATLAVFPTVPMTGLVLILGINRFLSECIAITNVIGNCVATIVVSAWEGELDRSKLNATLGGTSAAEVAAE